ncbi:structural maintenance of chromosomes protein 6-like [Drosophila pseudoobscura]|uniref:Structural maintenance of chromosomes protein 6-like n=1 Tax=Drosophila pseudoobscura pseudoobscura TaxID=46245 RepID=A0A6I8VWK1_DROPS|nr:structural maintenance of chromosomes protein 6 [Drosophila pseudoobscura]
METVEQDMENNTQRSSSSSNLSLFYEPELPSDFNRCGKVISIHVDNFMCHENFTVEFGPNTNFLVGKNGSGKSATITALTVPLAVRPAYRSSSKTAKGQPISK